MLAVGLIFAAVCVTLSIYSTSASHTCYTANALRLYNPNGNTTTEGGMLQICRPGLWRAVCDWSFSCFNGRAACRQLGYSGSQISEWHNCIYTLKVVVHTVPILPTNLQNITYVASTCVKSVMECISLCLYICGCVMECIPLCGILALSASAFIDSSLYVS